MLTCELETPRYAIAGEPFAVRCRVVGGGPRADVEVEVWRTRPGRSLKLATVRILTSAAGEGDGDARITLDRAGPAGDLVPVTLVATPHGADGAGAPDTEVVLIR